MPYRPEEVERREAWAKRRQQIILDAKSMETLDVAIKYNITTDRVRQIVNHAKGARKKKLRNIVKLSRQGRSLRYIVNKVQTSVEEVSDVLEIVDLLTKKYRKEPGKRALALKEQGYTWSQVASKLGYISAQSARVTAFRYKNKIKEQT